MIVLDTNVLSALMQSEPEARVASWLNDQPREVIWTTSISVFEIRAGLQSMVKGKRQKALQAAFEHALQEELEGRVLDFDLLAAEAAASISTKLRAMGRPIEIRDLLIAGIIAARRGTLATRNAKHFADTAIPLVNPWDSAPGRGGHSRT